MAKSKNTSKKEVDSLVLVTSENRKFCICLGRRVYLLGTTQYIYSINTPDFLKFIIFPRRLKGQLWETDENGFKCKYTIHREELKKDFTDGIQALIHQGIQEARLYININEPLVQIKIINSKGELLYKTGQIKL